MRRSGLIGGAAGLLARLQASQKLGQPGVKTSPIPGSRRLQVELPERVLDYTSEAVEVDKRTLEWLPQDTSFGQRRLPGARWISEASVNVVLMGSDRTSLHKTEFCLEGQGWRIDRSASSETKVHLDRPCPYDLPVMKFIATKEVTGQRTRPDRPGRLCVLVRGRRRRVHRAALAADVVDGPRPVPHRRFAALGLDQLFHRLRPGPGGRHLRADEEVHRPPRCPSFNWSRASGTPRLPPARPSRVKRGP